MKVRSDFVSNSSSCSFVLKQPFEACKQLFNECKESLDSISWADVDSLEVVLYGSEKDLKQLKSMLDFGNESIYPSYCDDGLFTLGVSATTFLSVLADIYDSEHSKEADAFSKVAHIQFTTDDYDRAGVRLLYLLYEYFGKNCKADVSREDSEHDFSCDSRYDFVSRLEELVS